LIVSHERNLRIDHFPEEAIASRRVNRIPGLNSKLCRQLSAVGSTVSTTAIRPSSTAPRRSSSSTRPTPRQMQGGMTFTIKRLAEEKEVQVDEAMLDRYVGKYEYPGLGVLSVRRDKNRLLAQMTGQPEFELFAKAPDAFFWKAVVAEIKFVAGDDGKVEKAIHEQSGSTIEAKKIE
jgi:hypothetical protein